MSTINQDDEDLMLQVCYGCYVAVVGPGTYSKRELFKQLNMRFYKEGSLYKGHRLARASWIYPYEPGAMGMLYNMIALLQKEDPTDPSTRLIQEKVPVPNREPAWQYNMYNRDEHRRMVQQVTRERHMMLQDSTNAKSRSLCECSASPDDPATGLPSEPVCLTDVCIPCRIACCPLMKPSKGPKVHSEGDYTCPLHGDKSMGIL